MAVVLNLSLRSVHWKRASERGQSMVELALMLPILFIIMLGATDLARVYYGDVQVREAAYKGVAYGAVSTTQAGDLAGIRTAALNGNTLITSATVTAGQVSDSSGGTAVSVTVASSFSTLVQWPGLPHSITITHTSTSKVLP